MLLHLPLVDETFFKFQKKRILVIKLIILNYVSGTTANPFGSALADCLQGMNSSGKYKSRIIAADSKKRIVSFRDNSFIKTAQRAGTLGGSCIFIQKYHL